MHSSVPFARGSFAGCLIAALLLTSTASLFSQGILAPPPLEFSQPTADLRPLGTNKLQSVAPPMLATADKQLQYGPIKFHPHLLYRFSYGDGIPSRPGEHDKTVINELSPGVFLQLGNHWQLDYTPTLRYYSSSRFRDTLDHSVSLHGGTAYDDWVLGLSQVCSLTSEPLAETGTQTDQEIYTTSFNASRHLGSHLSLELGLNQSLRFADQGDASAALTDSAEWSTMDWLNYQFWPNLGAALGAGFGYVDVSAGSDMTFEQLQGRINWQAGEKLGLLLNGGVDIRQFLDSDLADLVNPLFGLSIQYHPFEQTTVSISGSHAVNTSYFQNQVTETTSLSGSLRQRLLGRLYLDVSGGYSQNSYQATTQGISVEREDDNTFFSVRLSVAFLKRATGAIFYYASDNTSNDAGFTYSSDQVGFELGWRY